MINSSELTLEELKDIEFNLLKEFRLFCEENNIRYYLTYGTLLGAIRYKKFIPWDDDVDVLVPREDYEKFIEMYRDNGKYRLYSIERNDEYGYPFAKLCDMTTRKDEFNLNNGVVQGVDIDIFPLDYWDNDLEKAKKDAIALKKYFNKLSLSKLKSITHKNPIKAIILKMMVAYHKMLGPKYYIKQIDKISKKDNQSGNKYMGVKAWCVYGVRGICPAEAFSDSVDVEFEGELFPAPVGYDTYLTCLYGDYLPEPPKEKQVTHHGFKAYRVESDED